MLRGRRGRSRRQQRAVPASAPRSGRRAGTAAVLGSDSPIVTENVPIGRVFVSQSNPRRNDDAVPRVADSLRRFGWQQPIVARRSGEVIAGNTRLKAALSLGMTEVPVVWFDGSDLDATAYAIADNRTHEFAEWNDPVLATMLEHLRDEDAMEGVGFSAAEMDDLLTRVADANRGELDDPGPKEPPEDPVSRPGDLWILGDHRLLCGDSTNPEHVARLMGTDKAALMATDPPYGVAYSDETRVAAERACGQPQRKVKWDGFDNDEKTGANIQPFLEAVFRSARPHLMDTAAWYLWHAHLTQAFFAAAAAAAAAADLLLHCQIIWVKPSLLLGFGDYHWRHELCFYGWVRGHRPPFYGERNQTTVWEITHETSHANREHPTQKPVEIFEIPMNNHTKPGEVCFEPFSGSGSQLVAAEKLGRRCRAMEISPAFVDVAVRRWEKATGKQARLENGRTFDEVASERSGDSAAG